MGVRECVLRAKNRVSYDCIRAADLRKGTMISQHDAFIQANSEWKIIENGGIE